MKWMERHSSWTLLLLILCGFLTSPGVWAQSEQTKLTEKELKGKRVFMKHCALCHLPPPETKPKMRPSSGPILNGLLKDAKPAKEELMRRIILKGTPRMPGFEYTLDRSEMDNLIAFMKTLNDINAYMNGL